MYLEFEDWILFPKDTSSWSAFRKFLNIIVTDFSGQQRAVEGIDREGNVGLDPRGGRTWANMAFHPLHRVYNLQLLRYFIHCSPSDFNHFYALFVTSKNKSPQIHLLSIDPGHSIVSRKYSRLCNTPDEME